MSVTQLFENERCKVLRYVLSPGEEHSAIYPFPTLVWQVGTAHHKRKIADSPFNEEHLQDKHLIFLESNRAITTKNLGKTPSKQFHVQILQPPTYSEDQVRTHLSRALYPTKVGDVLLLENEWCRVWSFTLPPGTSKVQPKAAVHQHCLDYLFVIYGDHPHPIKVMAHDYNDEIIATLEFSDGDVYYSKVPNGGFEEDGKTLQRWPTHWPENGSDEWEFNEALVELK